MWKPLNPPLTDWHHRTVWIVGASSGIGRALASELHRLGAVVVVSARNATALNDFVAQHPGSHAATMDVATPGAAAKVLESIVQRQGQLDMVVYCAGHYAPMGVDNFSLAEANQHLAINYQGALSLVDAVLPVLLRQQQGHLSLVASVAGYRGLPQSMAYGPTKAALQHLADNLFLDLRRRGIGVSVVNPGFVATPLTAGNTFAMPALLTPQQAAAHMVAGWRRGLFEIHFPKRFTLWLKLLQHLPHRWYFAAVSRFTGH
jgi:NAD(P)-dependent dehydrogenase (short-subunit alcohol dehydrogenase family)